MAVQRGLKVTATASAGNAERVGVEGSQRVRLDCEGFVRLAVWVVKALRVTTSCHCLHVGRIISDIFRYTMAAYPQSLISINLQLP